MAHPRARSTLLAVSSCALLAACQHGGAAPARSRVTGSAVILGASTELVALATRPRVVEGPVEGIIGLSIQRQRSDQNCLETSVRTVREEFGCGAGPQGDVTDAMAFSLADVDASTPESYQAGVAQARALTATAVGALEDVVANATAPEVKVKALARIVQVKRHLAQELTFAPIPSYEQGDPTSTFCTAMAQDANWNEVDAAAADCRLAARQSAMGAGWWTEACMPIGGQ